MRDEGIRLLAFMCLGKKWKVLYPCQSFVWQSVRACCGKGKKQNHKGTTEFLHYIWEDKMNVMCNGQKCRENIIKNTEYVKVADNNQ